MKRFMRSPLGALAAGMVLSTAAWAGTKSGAYVAITLSGGTGSAGGSMGNVRNTTDSLQYIGCTVITNVTATLHEVSRTLTCSARNASNLAVACTSTDPNLIDTAQAMTSDAYIQFAWDVDGSCTYLRISNYSQYAPKEP